MDLKAPRNPNYAATVVRLSAFVALPNCDNIMGAIIFGNHVIVSKDAKVGDAGLFFPVETALSDDFIRNNNLYRKPEWGNVDPAAKGFFEQHGRVKCVKFRGHKSEGFFIPLASLQYVIGEGNDTNWFSLDEGKSFDFIGEHEICRKYVPKRNLGKVSPAQARVAKLKDQIVDNQFRFHTDTENLRRNVHKVQPHHYISVSGKWHGTSVVIGKVLIKRKLSWLEKLARLLGAKVQEEEYGVVNSSRRVIKTVAGVRSARSKDFYTQDIWGIVAKEVEDKIPVGYTLYGEIVGYTPDGSPIQAGYHYGCPVGGHKFLVYKVTTTNAEGKVLTLPWPQQEEFCKNYCLDMVPTLYYGKAKYILPKSTKWIEYMRDWQNAFLSELEKLYVNDQPCEYNNNEVPAEGVVVRIDGLEDAEAFKLKNFAFLERESKALDKGEMDLETAEAEEDLGAESGAA